MDDVLSAAGANPAIPGMTRRTLDEHWGGARDHSYQYPGFTKEQYAERALTLAQSPVGGNISGYRRANGSVVRYDKVANDYVVGYATGIATMYKPDDGEEYFIRKMEAESES